MIRDRAFELIFREHNRMITAYLHSVVGDWEAALDLTQDVFVTAHRRMHTFDPERSIGAWLRGIARKLAGNWLKKRRRHRECLVAGNDIDEVFALFDSPASDERWDDRLRALDECLGRLPENQRKVVDLFYMARATAKEIAQKLAVVEKSVFQTVWRARRNLHRCIQQTLQCREAANG
ncbi:MAG: sigma-70 family RNA polymerase sigma factor [Kiritimatiellae bacterium]|nr:sigma-70 family RNA polymerase sigma factor [Kiritimatiellia bacterium]